MAGLGGVLVGSEARLGVLWRAGWRAAVLFTLLITGCEIAAVLPEGVWTLQHVVVDLHRAHPGELEEVTVLRQGARIPSVLGMSLQPGDEIVTSDRAVAVLAYGPRSEVVLDRATRVRLGSIRLFFGRIYESLEGFLETETDYANAFPAGTRFQVEAQRDGTVSVAVVEGPVRVESPRNAWPSLTLGRYQVATTVRGSPLQVRSLEPAQFNAIVEWVNRVQRVIRPMGGTVLVPDLKDLSLGEAAHLLEGQGLRVGQQRLASQRGKEGSVTAQDPPPGASVATGSAVNVVVTGRGIRVPSLEGRSVAAAREALDRVGLNPGRQFGMHTGRVRPGTVVRQEPRAGELVPPGRAVDYWVEEETPQPRPPPLVVPSVVGQALTEAERRLDAAGLAVGAVRSVVTGRFEPDTVARQEPAAGTRIEQGVRVNLWIEERRREPEPVTVPDVLNLRLDTAVDRVRAAGLEKGSIRDQEAPPRRTAGTVLDQEPRPGTRVPPGTAVHLVVAAERRVQLVSVPELRRLRLEQAVRRLDRAGLKTGRIRRQISRGFEPDTVIDQEPRAGAQVERGSAVNLVATQRPGSAEPERPSGMCTVPPVVGKSLNDARAALRDAGLVGRVTVSTGVNGNRVTVQKPKPGSELRCGGAVELSTGTLR